MVAHPMKRWWVAGIGMGLLGIVVVSPAQAAVIWLEQNRSVSAETCDTRFGSDSKSQTASGWERFQATASATVGYEPGSVATQDSWFNPTEFHASGSVYAYNTGGMQYLHTGTADAHLFARFTVTVPTRYELSGSWGWGPGGGSSASVWDPEVPAFPWKCEWGQRETLDIAWWAYGSTPYCQVSRVDPDLAPALTPISPRAVKCRALIPISPR